jgi:hypothetical protein
MCSIVHSVVSQALVGLVAAGCTSGAASPTSVPAAVHVTGTDSHSGTGGTEVLVGDVTQVRGAVITAKFRMSDPRVSGNGTGLVSADMYGKVGTEWGTSRIENAAGAWEGIVTGAIWADQNTSDLSGWLVGSGAYKGYTYYWHLRTTGDTGTVDGIIFRGSPPTP